MPRPRLCRKVSGTPKATCFKPTGVAPRNRDVAHLTVEGLEALRLADLESLTTAEASARMGVSRHTFGRMLGEARRIVTDALVHALILRIEGGAYALANGADAPVPDKTNVLSAKVVAISSHGPTFTDMVDSRFGRADGFLVVDLETMSSSYLDNGPSQAKVHGAGTQTVERIADAGAGVLLTGVVGSKAFLALDAAGVKVVVNMEAMTVGQAVERYMSGQVVFADGPNKSAES